MQTNKSLEQKLSFDPHFVAIEPAENWRQIDVDYKLFKETNISLRDTVTRLVNKLNCHYAIDNFEDHKKRSKWRRQ